MHRLIAGVVLITLCSCAPSLGTVSSSGGIVKNYGWTPNQALAVAQAHCEKHGKNAIVTSQNDYQDNMTFQCVAK